MVHLYKIKLLDYPHFIVCKNINTIMNKDHLMFYPDLQEIVGIPFQILFFYLWCYSSEEPRPTEMVAARLAVQGDLVVSKALSLNLNFSFLNCISLLLISSGYPIGLTRLGGPSSRPYTSRKISSV